MRIHYFEAGTFWIDNISVVPTASIPVTLTIKPEIRHQEMVGFGESLTWYRERVLTSRHSAVIKQLLFEDLGLDLIRFKNWYYPSDYPTNKSASDPASKELHDEAKAANPAVKTLLSSWSPPVSLKSNGSLNNGGTLASDANGYRYADFAQYWVDALDRLGWEPDYLSFQNEPGYVATWKSCIFRPTQTPVHAGYAEASDAIYHAIKDILGDGTNNTGLSDLADLSVGSGATLQLNYSAASPDTIHKLFLGGVQAASGTWGALTSTAANKSALITGTGLLNVLSAPPLTDPFADWMTTNYPGTGIEKVEIAVAIGTNTKLFGRLKVVK